MQYDMVVARIVLCVHLKLCIGFTIVYFNNIFETISDVKLGKV